MNLSRFSPRVRQDFSDAEEVLRRYQRWDDRVTAEVQLRRLQAIWNDCVEDVPYYGDLVARGDAPRRIGSWDEFHGVPELTRAILQDQSEAFVRISGPPDLTRMTGGSTGNPIRFGVWSREDQTLRVLKLALWLRAGYRPEARLFLLWGHSHLLGQGWRRHVRHGVRMAKDWALGYRRVDAYTLSPEICRQYARSLRRYRPAGLIGYASALDYFVRCTEEFWDEFRKLGIRFVMPCAEPAPKPDTFELLRSVFACPVVQEFGGVDFGQVAMQFAEGPFEVFHEHNLLEADRESEETTESHAVRVTSLYRRYLPLVRYRQGDAIEGAVTAEHGHVMRFEKLAGRVNDMFALPCGAQVHSVSLFHCIHQEPLVRNIQMVLTDQGPRLRLATADGTLGSEVEARIRYRLGQIAPALRDAPIEAAADVETSAAGKRRWFVDRRSGSR